MVRSRLQIGAYYGMSHAHLVLAHSLRSCVAAR
jgi:hypothetical protein